MSESSSTVFVVGLPRSGTKLLRDLLNRHPDIAIFPHESHFIPYFHHRFHRYGDISKRTNFERFLNDVHRTTFGRRMAARGVNLNGTRWHQKLHGADFQSVLEAMFASYREMTGARVVGDKTPEYVTQVPMLSRLLPNAKFIHICRDPRDYALSIHNAWHKTIPRAVQRWKDQIRKFRRDVADGAVAHLSIRYEDLIASTEATLTIVCKFLDVPFHSAITSLETPSENLGDARGHREVLRENAGKWKIRMSAEQIQDVERIAGGLMCELGYCPIYQAGDENVSELLMLWYQLLDGANLIRFRVKEEGGIVPALHETFRARMHAGLDE